LATRTAINCGGGGSGGGGCGINKNSVGQIIQQNVCQQTSKEYSSCSCASTASAISSSIVTPTTSTNISVSNQKQQQQQSLATIAHKPKWVLGSSELTEEENSDKNNFVQTTNSSSLFNQNSLQNQDKNNENKQQILLKEEQQNIEDLPKKRKKSFKICKCFPTVVRVIVESGANEREEEIEERQRIITSSSSTSQLQLNNTNTIFTTKHSLTIMASSSSSSCGGGGRWQVWDYYNEGIVDKKTTNTNNILQPKENKIEKESEEEQKKENEDKNSLNSVPSSISEERLNLIGVNDNTKENNLIKNWIVLESTTTTNLISTISSPSPNSLSPNIKSISTSPPPPKQMFIQPPPPSSLERQLSVGLNEKEIKENNNSSPQQYFSASFGPGQIQFNGNMNGVGGQNYVEERRREF
uniref:Uncharacterized protein n=1 Tax=Meloidogyne floridensis TaxID=298350 RepID=A0A915PDX1_9BILA